MGVIVRFFVLALMFFLAYVPCLYAFSLGAIEVKSNFGDQFNAEIPVIIEGKAKVEVHIGGMDDYGKLGLDRPKIVDDLEVKFLPVGQGNNRIINIISSRPLFYPSFNLVIRAETQGDVILESFLVAVDFQQNVSLSLKGKKENIAETPGASKEAEIAQAAKKLTDVLSLPSASESVRTKVPHASSEILASGSKPVNNKLAKLKPVPLSSKEQAETSLKPPSPPVVLPAGAVQGKTYGPIQPGETLWRISEKVSAGSTSVARMTVALWRANKDKFLGGNIHGVKIGETLDLENLDQHLEGLSQSSAMEIVQSQLPVLKRTPVVKQPLQTDPDNADIVPEIRLLLEEWRKSWEEGNLDRHMTLFSKEKSGKNLSYAMWKGIKKRMFDRHKNVDIGIEQPTITQNKGRVFVRFNQHFRSDRMETFGQKTIDLVRAGVEWKIIGERFVPEKEAKKDLEAPSPSKTTDSSETLNPQSELMQVLEEWRKSWEEGNLDRHMTYFSSQPISDEYNKIVPSNVWRKIKSPMFDHYKNVEIRLASAVIQQKGDRWIVACDQTFRSDKLKSFGRKYFEFVREGTEWKIVKEEFAKIR